MQSGPAGSRLSGANRDGFALLTPLELQVYIWDHSGSPDNPNPSAKKHFRLGGMAVSEWTHSIRAVRDTPVAACSGPGFNIMRRIDYRPPSVVLLFLLPLSVSYFKRTLWRCGQM